MCIKQVEKQIWCDLLKLVCQTPEVTVMLLDPQATTNTTIIVVYATRRLSLLLLLHLLLGDLLILGQWSWRELIVLCSRSFLSSALWPHRRRPWPSFVWWLGGSLPSGGVATALHNSAAAGSSSIFMNFLSRQSMAGWPPPHTRPDAFMTVQAWRPEQSIWLAGQLLLSTAKRRPVFH